MATGAEMGDAMTSSFILSPKGNEMALGGWGTVVTGLHPLLL